MTWKEIVEGYFKISLLQEAFHRVSEENHARIACLSIFSGSSMKILYWELLSARVVDHTTSRLLIKRCHRRTKNKFMLWWSGKAPYFYSGWFFIRLQPIPTKVFRAFLKQFQLNCGSVPWNMPPSESLPDRNLRSYLHFLAPIYSLPFKRYSAVNRIQTQQCKGVVKHA
jgi:hypothetical protein